MSEKKTQKSHPKKFKEEAVALVTEQGYSVPEAAKSLGIAVSLLHTWKAKIEKQNAGLPLKEDERGECLLCEGNEIKFPFIKKESAHYPINLLCRTMKVSRSAYYEWIKRPAKLITVQELNLYRRIKRLFNQSKESLGSREMMKNSAVRDDAGF